MRNVGALLVLVMGASVVPQALAADADTITARDVVQNCNFKYPGDDQKTQLTIVLRDKAGNEKKTVYRRFWKDYKGRDGIEDKMVLFTEFPADAKGAGFMRWAYTAGADKNADQWIYLPELKKTRRVSVRDPGDSFLGSDLTYADIGIRELDADEHSIVQTTQRGEENFIVVQSVPRNKSDALYAKVVSVFVKGKDWDSCVKRQVDYFDKRGEPLKRQVIKWQQVDNAWLWDEVVVINSQTGHSSTFQVANASINNGLDDNIFSERNLSRGM